MGKGEWLDKYKSKFGIGTDEKAKVITSPPGTHPYVEPSKGVYKTPYTAKKNKKTYIQVDGENTSWVLSYISDDTLDKVKKVSDWEEDEDSITIFLPKESARYKKSIRTVQYCAYNATEDYMKHILGCCMDISDKDWFRDHPDITDQGLPTEYTIGVVNELASPYGIGVSRVYMRKRSTLSADMREWMQVLGVNPKSFVDRDCSNEEYLDMLSGGNPDTKEAMRHTIQDFHFEFVDTLPKGPYILFKSMSNAITAPGGGHATYVGPRSDTSGFIIAIQLDRIGNLKYHQAPTSKDYSEGQGDSWALDFWECLSKEGKKFDTYRAYTYSGPVGGFRGGYQGGYGGPVGAPVNEVITQDTLYDQMHGWEIG